MNGTGRRILLAISRGRRWVGNIARMEVIRNYKDFSRQACNEKKIEGEGRIILKWILMEAYEGSGLSSTGRLL